MASYVYRCRTCGSVFEVRRSVHAVAAEPRCRDCGDPGLRVFTAPALTHGDSPLSRAADSDRRSAHEPAVTAGPLPSTHRRHRPVNPLHAALPRP